MVDGNFDGVHWYSDIDTLQYYNVKNSFSWTAPRWLTEGDILFFYHTKNAKMRTASLLRQAEVTADAEKHRSRFAIPGQGPQETLESGDMDKLLQLLKRATAFAATFAGSIFGCAEAGGASEYFKDEDDIQHFRSTIYAPLAAVYLFKHPLKLEDFSDVVKIGQNTITPLFQSDFDVIKQRIARHNTLPSFLKRTRAGGLGFREVTAETWFQISCRPETRFIDEAQIRAYLLDYVLHTLKDVGTPLLFECQCFRNRERTGIVDYFVKIHGDWVPVEAKLNILSERDIFQQISKYIHIDSFMPTKGQYKDKVLATNRSPMCIVMDQTGMFVVNNGRFVACDRLSPLFKREQLKPDALPAIREQLASILVE